MATFGNTHERQVGGQLANWHYHQPPNTRRVSIHYWESDLEGAMWEVDGLRLPIYAKPRNMGEVWNLMERIDNENH